MKSFLEIFREIDYRILDMVKQVRFDHANSFFSAITGLGSTYFVVFLAGLLIPLDFQLLRIVFIPLTVTWLFGYLIKILVDRDKPHRSGLAVDVTPSFPSEHSITAVFLAIKFSFLIPSSAPILFSGAVAVCFSRVYLAAHYPSDVLAGAGIGVVAAFFPWALIL